MTANESWEISLLDAHDQAQLVRRRDVAPTALVEAAIARIEAVDPTLNAVSHRAFDHALAAAQRVSPGAPMAGVPYLLKASMEYTGFPVISGSRARRNAVAQRKHPFGLRMDDAGLVPCGMSTMPEFGLIGASEALIYGPTRNPWNRARGAGGSSGGAAVAVATGMVPFATGSDGGGSIRIPASHCGIIGFKPSRGWNLRARAACLADDLLASDALYGRSMRDTIWAAQFLRQQPPGAAMKARPLRIALAMTGLDGQQPEPEIASIIRQTARLCESLGHRVEEAELPLDYAALGAAFNVLWCYGAGEVADISHARLGDAAGELLEPWTLGLAERRNGFDANAIAEACLAVGQLHEKLASFWTLYDLALSPVTSNLPPELGVFAPDRPFDALWADHFRHVNYTQLQNLAGYPAISLPLFQCPSGMPAGSMFWSRTGQDDVLLALGKELEMAHPFTGRPPV